MKKWIFLQVLVAFCAFWLPQKSLANGIVVSNVRMTNRDTSAGLNNAANHTFIRFNISWQNSWRMLYSTGINNRDAAWVFVKFKVDGSNEWRTAWLNNTGHVSGTWTGFSGAGPMQFEPGLLQPDSAFNATTNPALGVFMYGSGFYMGTAGANEVQLRWNYGAQGLADSTIVEMRVFALEMAYVPTVGFWLGTGGTERGSFTNGSWSSGATIPYRITTEGAITVGNAAGQLWGRSSSGDSTIGAAGTLDAAFPKGYRGFYAQKYEITQKQWVDFFNTLTAEQKVARDITGPSGKNSDALVNRNNVSWTSGDATLPSDLYGDVACNFLSWADVAAYLDWSGLRPMTELELEKLMRGDRAPFPEEFAWGSSFAATSTYTITNPGAANEGIEASTYTAVGLVGNAAYSTTDAVGGPLRAGIFAANALSTGRGTAGAARYGAFETSGNVWERAVSVSRAEGRAFTGLHGNGLLSPSGQANVALWPDSTALGASLRGGGFESPVNEIMISDRSLAGAINASRRLDFGGRGARTRVCTLPGGAPDSVVVSIPPFENILEMTTGGAIAGEGYLWITPTDWRVINGQGTDKIFINVGTYPAIIRVVRMNECGAGTEMVLELLTAPTP